MTLFEDFTDAPETRWDYVADGVMGGVSEGQAEFVTDGDGTAVRLTGLVSTENNGGFIQVRRRFEGGFPVAAKGLILSVKGNGEPYFVFLRTKGQKRVFHSYRFEFETTSDWEEVRMDFADFYPSHEEMPLNFAPEDVTGIGIVAYGRAFEADVMVRRVEVY
ncbi:MAG: NADH ubiquinone oxidoreductase [Sulfitobacter sp.]|nr:NADH ubiquinone oxidoreductase [Sulfitobacter sp.]